MINQKLGALDEADMSFIQGTASLKYAKQLASRNTKIDWKTVFPKTSQGLINLLEDLL